MTKYSPRFGGGVTVDASGKVVGGVWPPLSWRIKKEAQRAKLKKIQEKALSGKKLTKAEMQFLILVTLRPIRKP